MWQSFEADAAPTQITFLLVQPVPASVGVLALKSFSNDRQTSSDLTLVPVGFFLFQKLSSPQMQLLKNTSFVETEYN